MTAYDIILMQLLPEAKHAYLAIGSYCILPVPGSSQHETDFNTQESRR